MYLEAANGFYDVEFSKDGTPFRWTGPQSAFQFMVYLDRSERTCATLTFLQKSQLKLVSDISCYVDRKRVETKILTHADRPGLDLSFEISQLDVVRATEIICVVPKLFVPHEMDPMNTDSRQLGVQFVSLEITRSENKASANDPDSAQNG